MTQNNDGVHAYSATCGVDSRYQTDEDGKRHCAAAEPAGKAEVLDKWGALSGGKAVDELLDDKSVRLHSGYFRRTAGRRLRR